jgi:hypothetical protein
MGKLTGSLIFVFLVQVILIAAGLSSIPGSTLYSFLTNPSNWDLSTLLAALISLPSLAGLGGIVYGTLFRNDLVTFAGITIVFLSFGQPLIELWQIINSSFPEGIGKLMALLFVSPIILIYILAVISFWRGQTD